MTKSEDDSWKNLLEYASGFHSHSYDLQESSEHLSAQKRILTDFKEIQKDPTLNIGVDLLEDSIYMWNVTFPAPNQKLVKAVLHFGSQYTFLPPRMFIKQRLFHPNISITGEVSLQDLQKIWTPAHCIWSLILSVQGLLSDPNPNDPINAFAADMLLKTPEAYHKYALARYEMLDFVDDKDEGCGKPVDNNLVAKVEGTSASASDENNFLKLKDYQEGSCTRDMT